MINYPFPIHHCDIGSNIQIAYCDQGKGSYTLLFVHGLANYIPVFRYNITMLQQHARCVAIDLPGNGQSSRGDYAFTMRFYAEALAKFIACMNLNNVVLVGHSMGGHISLLTALKQPHLVNKLVLLGSSGLEYFSELEKTILRGVLNIGSLVYADTAGLELAIYKSYYGTERKGAEEILSDLKQLMQADTPKYWRNMVLKNMEAMLAEPVFLDLHQLKQETLIVFGKQDDFIPNKFVHKAETPETLCVKAKDLIPNCSIEMIPDCGHFVQIEAADAVNALICKLIEAKEAD
jgi:pimeloyl-ACP methyl ester carboxylesterase